MKITKYFIPIFLGLAVASCSDNEPQQSTAHKPGQDVEEPNKPEEPSSDPDDDVVSPTPSFNLTNKTIAVNTSRRFQEIEGFGASDCWLPNTIGKHWTNRNQLATWLFSKSIKSTGEPQGIGLSMWRVNLGAGTAELGAASGISDANANNRAESYLNVAGTAYDWNKCQGQRYFMQQALNNGVEKFILFSNSPLVQYTLNGQGRSDNGAYANLKDNCYDDFAEYMADVAQHFTDEGYNIAAISPVNEPQYNWEGDNQEGSGWQNSEVAKLTRFLDQALTDRGLSTEITVGEAGSWESLYKGDAGGRENTIQAFYDPSSEAYIGDLAHTGNIICGHSYWTYNDWTAMRNVRQNVANAASAKGLRVWQTEWSMLGDAPSGLNYDNDSEFDIAQYMSRIIHNDLTVANCTSWSYWTAMSVERWSQKNRFELIKTTPSGGNYSDDFTTGGSIEATDNLWVLGNYSLFVRPGYVRVDVDHGESKDFFISGYMAPDNSKLVLVVTNYDKKNGMNLDMTAPEGTKAVYTYTTTATKHLQQERFNVKDKVFVDPASVTTIVYHF